MLRKHIGKNASYADLVHDYSIQWSNNMNIIRTALDNFAIKQTVELQAAALFDIDHVRGEFPDLITVIEEMLSTSRKLQMEAFFNALSDLCDSVRKSMDIDELNKRLDYANDCWKKMNC